MVAIVVLILAMGSSFVSASETPHISLQIGQQVIRCEAGPVGDTIMLKKMLSQGASITVTWVFSIQRERPYWLNEDAGEVVVTRVVSTDLISRHWQLKDEASGAIADTDDANRAVRFLSYLDNFPLIDRSLLVAGQAYQIRLKLHIRDSDQPQSWWQQWVDFGKTVLTQQFTLPLGR